MESSVRKRFRVGRCNATIFVRNAKVEGKDRQFFSVQLQRFYRDPAGEFRYTNSLDNRDLPDAIIALQKAYEFLVIKPDHPPSRVSEP